MDSDLDPFDDILSERAVTHGARAGAKFQPRAKPRPSKATSTLASSMLPINAKAKATTSATTSLKITESVQPGEHVSASDASSLLDSANEKSISAFPIVSSTLQSVEPINVTNHTGVSKPQENNDERGLEVANLSTARRENVGSIDALELKASIYDGNDDQYSDFGKSAGEADSLVIDLDSFDDFLPEPCTSNSSAGGKLQPKANPQPVIEISEPASSSPLKHTKEEHVLGFGNAQSTQFVASFDVGDRITDSVDPLLSSMFTVESREPLKENEVLLNDDNNILGLVNPLSEKVATKEERTFKDSQIAKVDSMEFDLDHYSDVVPQPAADYGQADCKFQPRGKAQPRKGTTVMVVSDGMMSNKSINVKDGGLINPSTLESYGTKEPPTDNVDAHLEICIGDQSRLGKSIGENTDIFLGLESIHDFVVQSTGGAEIPAPVSNDVTTLVSVTCDEATVHIDNRRLGQEVSGAYADLEMPAIFADATITSEHSSQKFQPKPEVHLSKDNPSSGIPSSDAVESVMPPPNVHFATSETEYVDNGSISGFPSDDAPDYSSIDLGDIIPPYPTTSEVPMNEETSHGEISQFHDADVVHSEGVPVEPGKESSKSRKKRAASNLCQTSKDSSLADGMNGDGKTLRQLRKRKTAPQLVEEPENEAHDNGHFPAGTCSDSVVDEEDNDYEYRAAEDNDSEYGVESSSRKKNATKKPVADKEKSVRKRKNAKKGAEQSAQEPPKKFSHSTRRNKRRVNQELLNMPEEEIDYQKLALRDIILLAEYKERLAIKEAKEAQASQAPLKNQSTKNSSRGEDSYNEGDTFASEQDGGYTDGQTRSSNQTGPPLFNHHSFMDRTPTVRWTKQDTELFYEGIRQFGTDLSMIQQLFPGRTRNQIKLKFKKEQRQQPIKLSEALNNRAKDHSYFKRVIEQLQQVAAEASEEFNREGSAGVTGDEEEGVLNSDANEEMGKSEQDGDEVPGDVAVEDQGADATAVHDSLKSGEDEDELDIWNSYRSEF